MLHDPPHTYTAINKQIINTNTTKVKKEERRTMILGPVRRQICLLGLLVFLVPLVLAFPKLRGNRDLQVNDVKVSKETRGMASSSSFSYLLKDEFFILQSKLVNLHRSLEGEDGGGDAGAPAGDDAGAPSPAPEPAPAPAPEPSPAPAPAPEPAGPPPSDNAGPPAGPPAGGDLDAPPTAGAGDSGAPPPPGPEVSSILNSFSSSLLLLLQDN